MLLWARRSPVACLHPGWTVLTDRDEIMASWNGILSNPESPRIACYDERVLLYGDTALVLCEEELAGGTLAASNFFVREEGRLADRAPSGWPDRPPPARAAPSVPTQLSRRFAPLTVAESARRRANAARTSARRSAVS